jgi:hypothetical protein
LCGDQGFSIENCMESGIREPINVVAEVSGHPAKAVNENS